MVLIDTSSTGNVVFKFVPRYYPYSGCGSVLIELEDEQTKEVFSYPYSSLCRVKYWMEATISNASLTDDHNYKVTVTNYDGSGEIFNGKAKVFDFTDKNYTPSSNQHLKDKTGVFTEREADNDFIVYNG